MRRYLFLAVAVATVLATVPQAQMRVAPVDDERGHVALGLALRHLGNTGIYMMATAHPDDENNGLLEMLNRGLGYRTALATATRGNGGQNEIGPELFEPLGVLRTEELAALHRFDGAEQYFTRAVDFGYTIDLDETLKQWGRDETIGDYVRLIRTIRPDVISAQSPTAIGPGQHAHHALAAILSREAYKVAGDPTKYPEQIKEGLSPWQPKKFYVAVGGPGGGNQPQPARTCRVDLAVYDSLLGRTWSEIGTEARSMHKCQGQAQLLALPGPSAGTFQLAETTIPGQPPKDERALFAGIDTTIAGRAAIAGARPPKLLVDGLKVISASIVSAQRNFENDGDAAAVTPLLAGLYAVRVLRTEVQRMALDVPARADLDFRLLQKEREFQQAVIAASGVRVEALADDGVVVPGQPVRVTVLIANNGTADVSVKQVKFEGFESDAVCTLTAAVAGGGPGGGGGAAAAAAAAAAPAISVLKAGQVARCVPTLKIPATARITEPYWHRVEGSGRYAIDADAPFGLPFRPTPFYLQVTLAFPSGDQIIHGLPVQYRYEGNIFSGEKRMDLLVSPAFSVKVSPEIAVMPLGPLRARTAGTREVRVTVLNDAPGAAEGIVRLELPESWIATPAEQSLKFTRADESQTVRFQVRPPITAGVAEYHVKATVRSPQGAGPAFDRGFEVIEYPHIRRQHFYEAANATIKILDVKTTPNLTIGYVMGTGDEVPPVIEQLGASVEMLGPDALAWGDLSKYDTIVLGVRAYERRDDLRANNSRLLEYVQSGGTVIVQYNRAGIDDGFGPYPAQVSNNRITDESAPVEILEPAHPIFNTPNKLTGEAWAGWVQERGLNFLGEKDSRYRDLVQLTDPFPNNPGAKRGALVEGEYGKGRWYYVALGLWRELPAGVDGAYPILANLISIGKAPAKAAAPAPRPAPATPPRAPARPAQPARPAPAQPARPASAPAPAAPAAPGR
jgi:LmbE family N-acetylglucosaminyl deacetylase